MATMNRQWLLKERPRGSVGPQHFEQVQSPMPRPDLAAGQVLLKTLMLGFDPAMRGWLVDEPSYLPPVAIGEPMRASGVGQVMQSDNTALPVGTLVQGLMNWQEYSIGDPAGFIPPTALPDRDTAEPGTQRIWQHQPHRILRPAGCRPTADWRNRPGVRRSRSNRLGRRPDRQAKRLPGRRHRRWAGKVRVAAQSVQARCRDRLQKRGPATAPR